MTGEESRRARGHCSCRYRKLMSYVDVLRQCRTSMPYVDALRALRALRRFPMGHGYGCGHGHGRASCTTFPTDTVISDRLLGRLVSTSGTSETTIVGPRVPGVSVLRGGRPQRGWLGVPAVPDHDGRCCSRRVSSRGRQSAGRHRRAQHRANAS